MAAEFTGLIIHFSPMPSRADTTMQNIIYTGQGQMVAGTLGVSGLASPTQMASYQAGLAGEIPGSSAWLTYLNTWVVLD